MANTIKIKQTAQSLFEVRAPQYFNENYLEGSHYFGYTLDYKALIMHICKGVDENSRKVLVAEIAWCYSTRTAKKSPLFSSTLAGFKEACAWLDEQRIVFVKELL